MSFNEPLDLIARTDGIYNYAVSPLRLMIVIKVLVVVVNVENA